MVIFEYNKGFYDVTVKLPRTSFNKELLKKVFGIVVDQGNFSIAIIKAKHFSDVSKKIENYLQVINLLNG